MTKPVLESVAKALVINDKNEALILTVGEYKARPDKSFTPDLPGGVVDSGETAHDAVVREVYEETGIQVSKDLVHLAYTKTDFFSQENKSVSKFLYIIYLATMPAVSISWEHAAYQWVKLDELPEIDLRPFCNEAVAYCFSNYLLK